MSKTKRIDAKRAAQFVSDGLYAGVVESVIPREHSPELEQLADGSYVMKLRNGQRFAVSVVSLPDSKEEG